MGDTGRVRRYDGHAKREATREARWMRQGDYMDMSHTHHLSDSCCQLLHQPMTTSHTMSTSVSCAALRSYTADSPPVADGL